MRGLNWSRAHIFIFSFHNEMISLLFFTFERHQQHVMEKYDNPDLSLSPLRLTESRSTMHMKKYIVFLFFSFREFDKNDEGRSWSERKRSKIISRNKNFLLPSFSNISLNLIPFHLLTYLELRSLSSGKNVYH